jgi:hypothetical protein
MLSSLFIGFSIFMLMGIPTIAVVFVVYGLTKLYSQYAQNIRQPYQLAEQL